MLLTSSSARKKIQIWPPATNAAGAQMAEQRQRERESSLTDSELQALMDDTQRLLQTARKTPHCIVEESHLGWQSAVEVFVNTHLQTVADGGSI